MRRRRHPDRDPLLAGGLAALTALATSGYVLLSRAVAGRHTSAEDARVRRKVPKRRRKLTKQVTQVTGRLGKPYVHGPLALGASALLLRRGHGARAAAVPLGASLAAAALSRALEQIETPRRPPPGRHKPSEPSFPSGHALETTAVAAATAYVLVRTGETTAAGAGAAAVAVPLLSGLGRLYLDRHWSTDIGAGWLAGLAVASGCALAYELTADD